MNDTQIKNEIGEIIRRWKEHAYDEEISVADQYLMDIDELLLREDNISHKLWKDW